MIQIKNLNKIYKTGERVVHACKDVNLTINENDIYGVMGLSGAGKSTLIRLLNRLEEPNSGEIIINGQDIIKYDQTQLREFRKKTGMIFQHFNLLKSRDVKGNVALALEIAKWPKAKIKDRVLELLDLVGLSDKAHAYPSKLSGGQKQRVAIARALANNPKILLSDEATSALDPRTTKSILELLKDIQKKLGITIILITHQMEVIRAICNRTAIMEGGEVIEEGTTEDIFINPKTDIAKEFVAHLVPEEEEEINYAKTPGKKIIKIHYIDNLAKEPIVFDLAKNIDINLSILGGSIDKLVSSNIGHLILELSGDKELQDRAVNYLENRGLKIEVVYNG